MISILGLTSYHNYDNIDAFKEYNLNTHECWSNLFESELQQNGQENVEKFETTTNCFCEPSNHIRGCHKCQFVFAYKIRTIRRNRSPVRQCSKGEFC